MSHYLYPQSRRQLTIWLAALALLLLCFILFFELAEDVWLNEGFSWDATLMLAIHQLSQPWLNTFFRLVTQTAGALVVLLVGATAIYFWRRGEGYTAVLFIASFTGTFLFNSLLKLIFARPRPNLFPPLVVETSYSFPSGHTMAAIAFYGLLALVLWRRGHHGWAVLPGFWVLLVALSRVYLGAHYPSDVLASLAVGTVWLMIVWLAYSVKANVTASLSTTLIPDK